MIIQLRIDDRLIHGEVVAIWLGYTNADVVCVADDATATNPMLKMAMSLAKPAGVDMPILTIDDAIVYLNENADSNKRIFAVTQNAQNALKIAQNVEALKDVNAGALRASDGKKQVSLKVFVDEQDIKDLQEINSLGKTVVSQTKPDMKAMSLEEIITKAK